MAGTSGREQSGAPILIGFQQRCCFSPGSHPRIGTGISIR
jgi:hypothetical protein